MSVGEDSGWETGRGSEGVCERKGKEVGVLKGWDEGKKEGKLCNNKERLLRHVYGKLQIQVENFSE